MSKVTDIIEDLRFIETATSDVQAGTVAMPSEAEYQAMLDAVVF